MGAGYFIWLSIKTKFTNLPVVKYTFLIKIYNTAIEQIELGVLFAKELSVSFYSMNFGSS